MALPILAHWAGRSIFDIEPAALARRGIRLLLADLDNTLAPYGEPEPTQAVRDWAAALGEQGITLFVLSNNRHPERPRRFSSAGLPWVGAAFMAARGRSQGSPLRRLCFIPPAFYAPGGEEHAK